MVNESENLLEFKGFLSFLILYELEKKPLCGEDLAKSIGARRGSELTPGTIYPTLKKLKKLKLMTFKRFGRKKFYKLTDAGIEELKKQSALFANYFWGLKRIITKTNKDNAKKYLE